MNDTPYDRGYQAGVCHLPFDDPNVEEEYYYHSLSTAQKHVYELGKSHGYGGKPRIYHVERMNSTDRDYQNGWVFGHAQDTEETTSSAEDDADFYGLDGSRREQFLAGWHAGRLERDTNE